MCLAVEMNGLVLGEGEEVVVNGGIVDVAIHDGVEREGLGGFGRVIGAVLFFGMLADDEGSGSGEPESGLSGGFVNAGRNIGGSFDEKAEGIGFGGLVVGRGSNDGSRGEAGVREAEGSGFLEFSSADGDSGGAARLDPLREDGLQVGVRELRVEGGRTRNRERQSFKEAKW